MRVFQDRASAWFLQGRSVNVRMENVMIKESVNASLDMAHLKMGQNALCVWKVTFGTSKKVFVKV